MAVNFASDLSLFAGSGLQKIYVYNTITMQYEAMTQPYIDATNSNLNLAVDGIEGKLDTLITKATQSTTATVTSVSGSAINVTLLSTNANRKMAAFFNDSTADALHIKK